jgi:hypothetical protein
MKHASIAIAAFLISMQSACSSKSSSTSTPTYATRDTLLDPRTCAGCHQSHYDDWSGSMHAYASDDPIFRAMNARGQRETNGKLGNFCVQCHAPIAVHEGATTDGLNLDQVPTKLHGVTCFFCHTVASVDGAHNNALTLATDITMRGEYSDPIANAAHPSAYSTLHDRSRIDSATMCGACHDVVTPQGAAIERTFQDWQNSLFSNANGGDTCSQCHMPKSANLQPIADVSGSPSRYSYGHNFVGVDQALASTFPNATANAQAIQTFLSTTLQSALCVVEQDGTGAIRVILDNVAAGHTVTSGSAQDRRLWVEIVAYQNDQVIYQSGAAPDGSDLTQTKNDPDFWLIRDCMFDANDNQVNMFWQASSYETNLIPFPVTSNKTDPRYYQTHIEQQYPRNATATLPAMPDRVTMRVRMQPIGIDVLNDLVATGDLDPSIVSQQPTYDLLSPATLTWTMATANATTIEGRFPVSCITTTALNVQAQTTIAVNHAKCSP